MSHPAKKSTPPPAAPAPLEPTAAYELLRSNPQAVLIDIRSTMEYLMVGHPVGAIHVAWLDEPDWTPNERFVPQVREVLLGGALGDIDDSPPVILICRSGRRSLDAGRALIEAGVPAVHYVQGGFEGPLDESHHRSTAAGWRCLGLPWEQC